MGPRKHTSPVIEVLKRLSLPIAFCVVITCGTLTSSARANSMSPTAQDALTFAEMKIFGADGKPYRKPVEDWNAASRLVSSNPAWKKWVDDRIAFIDNWSSRYSDRQDWVAGASFEYTDTHTGSRLEWFPDKPAPRLINGRENKAHGGWVALFRRAHAERMVEAARLYRLTGEKRFAEWVSAQLDFYAEGYGKWPLRKRVGLAQLGENSLDESNLVVRYAEVARLIEGYPSQERRQRWVDGLFDRIGRHLAASYHGLNNISIWQRVAMGVIAIETGDSALLDDALNGDKGLVSLLSQGINKDYIWIEGSIAYGNYVVYAMLPLLQHAALRGDNRTWEALSKHLLNVENVMIAPLYLRFPDGFAPTPSDGNRMQVPDKALFLSARRVFPTAFGFEEEKKRGMSWELMLDPMAMPYPAARYPSVVSRNLEASRMAILKSGPWQVFFHYGQSTGNHAQEEALNYELYFGNTPISYDTGSAAGYGSVLQENYFRRAAAQNVPLARGKGQEGWHPGRLVAFQAEGVVEAEQPSYRSNVKARRRIEIRDDMFEETTTVSDSGLSASNPSVGIVLNINCNLVEANSAAQMRPGNVLPEAGGFQFWTNVASFDATDQSDHDLVCGGKAFRLTFSMPGQFKVKIGEAPNTTTTTRTSFFISQSRNQATIRTIIRPHPVRANGT